jgi:hypothetical protein
VSYQTPLPEQPKRRRITRHHAQGFAVGIALSVLSNLIYDMIKEALG